MTQAAAIPAYGELIEPNTLRIRRLLPGPVERVWAYLTDSELRRQWLAAGEMRQEAGAPFELTWRNDELASPAGERPEGMPEEHSMPSRVVEIDPPRRLTIAWRNSGDVTFELEPKGEEVLLTLTHRRLPNRDTLLNVAAGWHAHLDVMAAQATDQAPPPFWDEWRRLHEQYGQRIPAEAGQ